MGHLSKHRHIFIDCNRNECNVFGEQTNKIAKHFKIEGEDESVE